MHQFPRTLPRRGPERERLLALEEKYPYVQGGDPEAKLARAGERLRKLILRLALQEDAVRELWKRYLASCHKHGVHP